MIRNTKWCNAGLGVHLQDQAGSVMGLILPLEAVPSLVDRSGV